MAALLGWAQAEPASPAPQPLDVAAPLPQGRWIQATAVLQESPGAELTAAQALLQTQWRTLLPRTEYDFLDAQPHWVRLPLVNSGTTAAAVWLQIDYPWLRDARGQLLDLQGEPLSPAMRAGAGVPIEGRALRTALPTFPVTLAPGQEAVLMVRTEGTLWWPDRLRWVTAAEGAHRTTLQTAITALALGATLVFALVMVLQRTAGGMTAGLWISTTAIAEVVNIGHVALLPWLDGVVVPLSGASVQATTVSHVCLALMTFTLLGLHEASWTPRKLLAVVLVVLAMAGLAAWDTESEDRLINLPIYLAHGAGWGFLAIAWRAKVKQPPLMLGLLTILHLNWLISHGWAHDYGRLLSESPEVRFSIKAVFLVLLVAAYAQQSARQRRELQQSLIDAQKRQTAELEQQVSQRTHELRLALDDATQANQAKSQFISGMSHELRTPMNAILGFSQLMAEDARADVIARDGARDIHQAGRHLLDLIDDVLDLSKIELGRMDVRITSLSLAPLVRECCDLVQAQAEERQVSITCEGLDGVTLQADEGRLRQVVLNLLSNAVKYNHVGGWVRVSAEQVGDRHWHLVVQDGGPGISAEALARLFQPFERGDARYGPVQGTGIGLALSQRLTHLMNGRIGVHSEAGQGARFWVELPGATRATESASGAADAADSTLVPVAGLQRPHAVLCVDDNPVNLKLLVRMLQRETQLQVHTCQDSNQALEQALEIRPSLILLDINMPGLDGYQLLALFRQHPTLAAVPVVAVTADAMKHDVDRGREAGFTDYLTKPLELGTLRRVLSANLQALEARA